MLKNLPVVFTFAPMNLLYYRVEFPPKATRVVAVSYKQYCYLDTKAPQSYQLAYVLHPASLWDSFGPINLKVIGARRGEDPRDRGFEEAAAEKRRWPNSQPRRREAGSR